MHTGHVEDSETKWPSCVAFILMVGTTGLVKLLNVFVICCSLVRLEGKSGVIAPPERKGKEEVETSLRFAANLTANAFDVGILVDATVPGTAEKGIADVDVHGYADTDAVVDAEADADAGRMQGL